MRKETRTAVYDEKLRLEAYRLTGTAQPFPAHFHAYVVCDEELACSLRRLHALVMEGAQEFDREEQLLVFLSLLLQRYGQPFAESVPECRDEIEKACAFMEQHYAERICLDQICRCAGLSKSTLLRAFARSKGVTPYR